VILIGKASGRGVELSRNRSNGRRPSCSTLVIPTLPYGVLASRLAAAGVAPTTTMVGVTRLAFPDLPVELEATAVA
jgi:hypothetical protein